MNCNHSGSSYSITSMGHSEDKWLRNRRRSKWWWVFHLLDLLTTICKPVHINASFSKFDSLGSSYSGEFIMSAWKFNFWFVCFSYEKKEIKNSKVDAGWLLSSIRGTLRIIISLKRVFERKVDPIHNFTSSIWLNNNFMYFFTHSLWN